jgi:hypothetical protein
MEAFCRAILINSLLTAQVNENHAFIYTNLSKKIPAFYAKKPENPGLPILLKLCPKYRY